MSIFYHIGVSGGKDSTALLLWMVNESGVPREQMVASFCDTQNEARETYDHIAMLSAKVFPIQWLETEGFFQLAKRKKRFPSTKARFCTTELKLLPTKRFLEDLGERCDELIPVSGVRRSESDARAKLNEWGNPLESYFGLKEWRPLIDWQIEDVFAIHAKYSIPLNPLYGMGARRVGCFPCIMSSKPELRALARFAPERIDALREAELSFDNASGISTFFSPNRTPRRFRSREVITAKGKPVRVCTIDDVIAWAKTGWRAQGSAPDLNGLYEFELKGMPPKMCLSQYQACE